LADVKDVLMGTIIIYLVATLAPGAISMISNASTAGWDPAVVALWGVTAIVAVIGFIIIILKPTLNGGGL